MRRYRSGYRHGHGVLFSPRMSLFLTLAAAMAMAIGLWLRW